MENLLTIVNIKYNECWFKNFTTRGWKILYYRWRFIHFSGYSIL